MSALNLENTKTTLLARLPQAKVAHVFRESKQMCQPFGKKGCSMQEDFVLFDSPPTSVEFDSLLASDMNGLCYCRLVAATLVSVAI